MARAKEKESEVFDAMREAGREDGGTDCSALGSEEERAPISEFRFPYQPPEFSELLGLLSSFHGPMFRISEWDLDIHVGLR